MKKGKRTSIRVWLVASACLNGIFIYIIAASGLYTPEMGELMFTMMGLFGNFVLSFLVSILYTRFCRSEDAQRDAELVEELKNEVRSTSLEMLEMAPSHVYPATNTPNEEFNNRLNASISKTVEYRFFSDKGTYLIKRLKQQITSYNERFSATVCLLDVSEHSAFLAREEEYRKREIQLKGKRTNAEIIRDEKIGVLQTLYAISQMTDRDIKVYLHKEIPFIRYEITDEILALSFLTMLMEGKMYPPTLIYANEKLFRQSYLDYFNDIISRSTPLRREDMTLEKLMAMGEEAGIDGLTEEIITRYYRGLEEPAGKRSARAKRVQRVG